MFELNELAHALDPTRPTTAATNMETRHPVNWVSDVVAFNRYWGWYSGAVTDWPRQLDAMRAAAPKDKSIGMSEYGAGASIKQHEVYPATRPATTGPWHPEEWQAIVHEQAYAAMKERPWLWGTFLWVMFDFASDGRHEGDHAGINDKGLVTGDRKTRKDAFYFYKANWSKERFVYITSRRFNPRPPGSTTLKVYSNCDSVDVLLNGVSLARRQNDGNGVFRWDEVTLKEGKNIVQARGRKGGKTCRDSITWTTTGH